jgi:hypothetical protein
MAHEFLLSLGVSAMSVWGLHDVFLILLMTGLIMDSTTARSLVLKLGKMYDKYEKEYREQLEQREGIQVEKKEQPEHTVSRLIHHARKMSWDMFKRATV